MTYLHLIENGQTDFINRSNGRCYILYNVNFKTGYIYPDYLMTRLYQSYDILPKNNLALRKKKRIFFTLQQREFKQKNKYLLRRMCGAFRDIIQCCVRALKMIYCIVHHWSSGFKSVRKVLSLVLVEACILKSYLYHVTSSMYSVLPNILTVLNQYNCDYSEWYLKTKTTIT